MMNNRNLLIMFGLLILLGITVLFMSVAKEPEHPITNSISDIIDSADDGVKEFREEVKDEIDDHTDAR